MRLKTLIINDLSVPLKERDTCGTSRDMIGAVFNRELRGSPE